MGFRLRILVAAVVAFALFTMRPALACTYEMCERQCWAEADAAFDRWYPAYYNQCLVSHPNQYSYCHNYANERADQMAYNEYEACMQGCRSTYGVPDDLPDIGGCIPGQSCEEE